MKMPEQELTLAVDVGNTRMKFGMFERPDSMETTCGLPDCAGSLAISAHEEVDWGVVHGHFAKWNSPITKTAVAGVNPAGMKRLLANWNLSCWPQPTIIGLASDLPLRTNVDHPDQVGIDRLLDGVAANRLRAELQPAIIIDSGTATTVNVVTADGVFEGGAILPGLDLQARSLHRYTALLPLIDVQSLIDNPVAALGRNTRAAIKSGIWFGQVGAIRELTAQLGESLGKPPLLLVTGGMGCWLAPALGTHFRFEADLALRALAFVAQGRDAWPSSR